MVQSMLVNHLLENNQSNDIAIVDRRGEITYLGLNLLANKVAEWLIMSQVKMGDRVVVCGRNSTRLVAAFFGVLKVGAIFVPIHPDTPVSGFDFVLDDCRPSAIIIDSDVAIAHKSSLLNLGKVLLFTSGVENNDNYSPGLKITFWTSLPNVDKFRTRVEISPNEIASIIYTSGSSDKPKGVMLPHQQIIFATSSINKVIGNTHEDVILNGLPLSFDYGLYQIFLAFQVGAKIILEPDFSNPMIIPRLLNDYQITGFPGVPSLWGMLLRSRLLGRVNSCKLRYISSTGDIFPAVYIKQLQEVLSGVAIFPMYGLTECKRVSILPSNRLSGHEESVGIPIPGTDIRIVDEDGVIVQPGVTGELLVMGPHIMAGYWNNQEETEKKFKRDVISGAPILYTGDYFYQDQEGFLYFMGRKETFIKSRGHKISPLEIEKVIYGIPGVSETVVLGRPHLLLGEEIVAFVSFTHPYHIDVDTIKKHCAATLLPEACPSRIVPLDAFPKTANGKIDRLQLHDLVI